MATNIDIQSVNQLLGQMIRKIIAETSVNDIHVGSTLLSLLEAAASNDYENNVAILNVLELLNIDAVKNNDLDARAGDYGLNRKSAIRASGPVTILNTNIVKRSTGLYVIKPAPIAGQTVLYVNSAKDWASTGKLYIGRGTASFEGPLDYSSITNFPTYSVINLTSALQKDHLISDLVIDSQNQPDRVITAGTTMKIPANNLNPEILYTTLRDAVIPSGEDQVSGVEVIAQKPGSLANASINTITQFSVVPFVGAGAKNVSAFSDGRDTETDTELRNRIKSYSITLARGTPPSILSSVIGISDPDDSKQVASAVLTEPVSIGEPSILYIDDGSGFEPSYAGQSVDILLNNANGSEEFLQLANYPLPRPQVVNVAEGPFTVKAGSFLRVEVDGVEETIYFDDNNFLNPAAATIAELVIAINNQSILFKARFTEDTTRILIYPVEHDVETIKVATLQSTDDEALYVNTLLKFPTDEFSYIALYQNSTRLREKERAASVETAVYSSWNISSDGNVIIAVDGTPAQDRNFVLSDFIGTTSFSSLTLEDWVEVFNTKFAGLTAIATPSQTMLIQSNKSGELSSINVTGGTLLNKWFPSQDLTSSGQSAQFELNRQTGNLRILTDIVIGDKISAGVEDAKGFSISSEASFGIYNVGNDAFGRPANMVIVSDSDYCVKRSLPLLVASTISITNPPSTTTMRIMSNVVETFASLLPGDFVYIAPQTSGWLNVDNTGLFKIKAKGTHLSANSDTYIDVDNINVVVESGIAVSDSLDIKAFSTDGYPQIWRGSYVTNPPAEPISGVVDSLNVDLIGVKASIFKSSFIKITSTSESNGSIAIPVAIGNAALLFTETTIEQEGNPSHIAHRTSENSLTSLFKRTSPVGTNVWLDRYTYTDQKGVLSSPSIPDPSPFAGTYSEIIESTGNLTPANVDYDDYVSFTRGNNKGQFRTIKAEIAGDKVGTQQGTARTELDHSTADEYELVRPVQLSSEDSIVIVMDNDSTDKTIDIKMSRTGQINAGSGGGAFLPTSTELSANDYDNEPGIDFSNLTVWGTSINKTNFSDYALWMQAHNWYSSGGVGSGQGVMLIRAAQFGPNGEKIRFGFVHPSVPDQSSATFHVNTPSNTTFSYVFGSGAARPTAITAGDSITVDGPYPDDSTNFPAGAASTGNYYDYTFSSGNFTSVMVDDVLAVNDGSGISNANKGQFRIAAINGNTLRVFNANASLTSPGAAEVTTVTAIDEVVGSPTEYKITTVADVAGSLHLKYFTIFDSIGSVAVWYDIDNTGAPPPPHGAYRSIKVAAAVTGDSASIIATKTGQAIALDSAFSIGVVSDEITITNVVNGALASATPDTSGFAAVTTTGTSDVSINGKYFTIFDDVGSVAIWFDVDNNGTPEPFHGAGRSIQITGVQTGDNATTIASAIVADVSPDIKLSASSLAGVVTITRTIDGNVPASSANTSGYTVADVDGSLSSAELITNSSAINVFPLVDTSLATIQSKINESDIVKAVAVSGTKINKATIEDDYAYIDNTTALAYGHNPGDANLRYFISLYDGENWVKSFSNNNPNFTMKTAFTLQGIAPSVYKMETAPNPDTTDVGELFKLIPVTVKNIYHQFTQKALSQLPIVANVSISSNRKNVQIASKNLGSEGSVEVVGGNANKSQAYITSESEVSTDASGKYLLLKIPAFPDTFNKGDIIRIENDAGVKRTSRLILTDSIDVVKSSATTTDYNYNPKVINFLSTTAITITDVSGVYGKSAGTVYRWTHDGSGTLSDVREGDLVTAFGVLTGWKASNRTESTGDGHITGLPIIAVNDLADYFDVVNPFGDTMASTVIGTASTVQICPTPIIEWKLKHASRVGITSIIQVGTTVTVTCGSAHYMNDGDTADIIDSDNLADGLYTSITVIDASSFEFTTGTGTFTEASVGASVIKKDLIPTLYRLEKLGFADMVRISRQDGASPMFADCGVAVDDYIVINGSTFKSNNNGRFRVMAVDNDSVIIINPEASNELNTIKNFNNKSFQATWVANTTIVTGVVGTFKNLALGDWVKKPEDPDTYYRQVTNFDTGLSATATTITLGGNYLGATSISPGVSYDQLNDYDKGVTLLSANDIIVYEGDSAALGDVLSVQNIINANWFNVMNIGSFGVVGVGVDGSTYKPFLQVASSLGFAEMNRLMSVNTQGFYLTEGITNKFYTMRQIEHIAIDDLNSERRSIYLTPPNRSYKFSSANDTFITHAGKFGYSTNVTTGVDGYLYYTGLLRRVQRTVDGYEPDPENYSGRRAVGGLIETLPPLPKRITISVDVTTDEGVNLGDISNNIKSVVINYVDQLGVGSDVILSEIIAGIMDIKGIGAVTFTYPTPNTERITIANNEKATITPESIGIS